MKASKLNPKYQVTVPKKIREFLNLKKGDFIGFEVKRGQVTVKKVSPMDFSFQSTFSEWQSDNDEEAYRDL